LAEFASVIDAVRSAVESRSFAKVDALDPNTLPLARSASCAVCIREDA
jgi:hypothetical protein